MIYTYTLQKKGGSQTWNHRNKLTLQNCSSSITATAILCTLTVMLPRLAQRSVSVIVQLHRIWWAYTAGLSGVSNNDNTQCICLYLSSSISYKLPAKDSECSNAVKWKNNRRPERIKWQPATVLLCEYEQCHLQTVWRWSLLCVLLEL